jgi:hypothetical protein
MLPAGLSKQQLRIEKIAAYHECLHHVLAPLKELSHSGAQLPDPTGAMRSVYPRALSFVADKPEQAMLSGVFDGHTCEEPCNR